MREVKRILGSRVMIKKLDGSREIGNGILIDDDGESLPEAMVVMVAEDITQLQVGDKVHYTQARESGKCRHKGETHYIIPISNAVAVIEDE